MKNVLIGISSITIQLLSVTAHAGAADLLKPEHQRQEQGFKKIMEGLIAGRIQYQVVSETREAISQTGWATPLKTQTVRLPVDVTEKMLACSPRLVRWHIPFYLDNPESSLYAAVFAFAYAGSTNATKTTTSTPHELPRPVIRHDKELWNQSAELKKDVVFFYTSGVWGKRGNIPPDSYYGAILFESLPPYYSGHVFSPRIHRINRVRNEPSAIAPSAGEHGKHFDGFMDGGGRDALKEIPLIQPCVEHWIWLTLFGGAEKRLTALDGLLEWSRLNAPTENPFLPALAMGLFTVDGYAFDDGTGVYTMNERGRMLMDFIAEFPIPENATRVQAVMDGGNKDEIEGMMKKTRHGGEMARAPQKPHPPRVRQIPAGLTAGKGNRKTRRGIREIEASGSAGLPPCLSFGKAEALRSRHNVATDYVRSSQTLMTYNDLQGINGKLYLEAINPSVNWSDIRIVVSLSVDGGSTWVASNAVRVTSMRCNFTVGVVRQFSIVNGARTPFVPDYSTPAACLRKAADAQIATQEYFGSPLHYEDPWRHDGDATLGHGFAYFQYEGPDLGNTLSTICANSVYDKKDYFGKTGQSGFTHWHYCKAVRNTQKQLAWWDVCDDTISGKYLVLKKTYTLRPDRLSKMHGDFMMDMGFPENGLYGYFGLHIDIINSGWGCLSNVGLTMELNNLDAANICDCKKNLTMPTTANKSVWKILKGTELLHRRSGFSVSPVLTGVIDAIVEESQGLDWGDTKALTQGAGGTLQGKLFNVLQGKDIVIPVEDGSRPFLVTDRVIIKVMSIGDIAIDDNATEFLEYYDPGLFPEVFGEQPESVFNMGDN